MEKERKNLISGKRKKERKMGEKERERERERERETTKLLTKCRRFEWNCWKQQEHAITISY